MMPTRTTPHPDSLHLLSSFSPNMYAAFSQKGRESNHQVHRLILSTLNAMSCSTSDTGLPQVRGPVGKGSILNLSDELPPPPFFSPSSLPPSFSSCAHLSLASLGFLMPSGDRNACHHYLQQMAGLMVPGGVHLRSSPVEPVSACSFAPETPVHHWGRVTILISKKIAVPDGQSTLSSLRKDDHRLLAARNWRKAAGQLPRPCSRSSVRTVL